jgi:hypothetical protein
MTNPKRQRLKRILRFAQVAKSFWAKDGTTAAGLAAVSAAGHDGGVEAFSYGVGELVDFVGAIDLDCFAGGVEGDFAVVAALEVLLQLDTGILVHFVVD